MMRSLYSGISGLKNHQTRMDVIGNNIANINTTGYKTSRVIFQDIFSQTVRGGMANTDINGGTNPVQIGLGIKLSTIDVMHTPAPYARTDNPFDMMVEGDGYFIVGYPVEFDDDGIPVRYDMFYTRAGNFKLDDEGFLTTSDGYYVLGYTGEFKYIPGKRVRLGLRQTLTLRQRQCRGRRPSPPGRSSAGLLTSGTSRG